MRHLGISIALEGRTSRWATGIVAIGYGVGAAAWLQTAIDPAHPILPAPPHFEPLGIPGEILGWGFILVRAGVFAAGLGWLVAALGRAGSDVARRRQLHATLVTLGLGIAGGMARILPEGVGGPAWLGVSLIAELGLRTIRDDIVVRPLGRDTPCRQIFATALDGYRSPATVAMIEMLRDVGQGHASRRPVLELVS